MYYTLKEKISSAIEIISLILTCILLTILILFVSLAAFLITLTMLPLIMIAVDYDNIVDNLAEKIVKNIDERKKIKNSIHL